jgi:hypothetical protein
VNPLTFKALAVLDNYPKYFDQMLLDPQRILFIGMPPRAIPVRTSKFFDRFNVTDFQLVVWNAETLLVEIQEKTGQSFQSYHHPFIYRRFKELYEEKIIPIFNWIKHGHILVIFPCLFNIEMKTDGRFGVINVDINQFPPFNLVNLTNITQDSLVVFDEFRTLFGEFIEILRCDIVLSGEDIVPLFLTSEGNQENSKIAGAAFRVGKGAIVFSPTPKAWDNPKLLKYLEALTKLPDMLGRRADPLPERTSPLHPRALWLAALPALIIATIALSPFWAPQVGQLLPWGGKPSAATQEYDALAARLSEIEKRPASSSFDIDAIKSAESALARRVDQLEAVLSRLQELPVARRSNSPVAPTSPAARPTLSTEEPAVPVSPVSGSHVSAEEIAALLARGDTLLRRGDVASARLFYERAANAGDGQAALRVGATFDLAFLGRDVLRGVFGDPAEARLWYQRARDLGEAEAERRLKSLETK